MVPCFNVHLVSHSLLEKPRAQFSDPDAAAGTCPRSLRDAQPPDPVWSDVAPPPSGGPSRDQGGAKVVAPLRKVPIESKTLCQTGWRWRSSYLLTLLWRLSPLRLLTLLLLLITYKRSPSKVRLQA